MTTRYRFLVAVFFATIAPVAHAQVINARVYANGVIDAAAGFGASDQGNLTASVHWRSDTDPLLSTYSSILLTGDASVAADQGQKKVDIKVNATGNSPSPTASAALVQASWTDHITVTNPQLTIFPADSFFSFPIHYSGTLTGSSSLRFVVGLVVNGTDYGGTFTSSAPGSFDETAIFLGSSLQDALAHGIDLQLEIDAQASASPPSVVDFSHTVTFGSFLIGDANGHPIPGFDTLVFTGDSSLTYGVQPIPEPSSLTLLAVSGLVAIFRRQRRL